LLDSTTIGPALHRARLLAGRGRRAAARDLGVTRRALRAWERGRCVPPSDALERLSSVYSRSADLTLVPRISLLDPTRRGVLVVGDERIERDPALGADIHRQNRALLVGYVAAVRRQRGLPSQAPVSLRSSDVAALAAELDLSDGQLGRLLAEVLAVPLANARAADLALVVTSLFALTAVGAVPNRWLADPYGAADRRARSGVRTGRAHTSRSSFTTSPRVRTRTLVAPSRSLPPAA
jgi:transcriptional regulator with XRE-family HTH domain